MSETIDSAYILAGGQSKRMARDKLFLKINGQTLIGRTINTCRKYFDNVKLAAKSNPKFRSYDIDVIPDWPGAEGPLAGIIAALIDCPSECCFITAADLYDLTQATIAALVDSYSGEDFLGIKENNGMQPLCGIYRKSSLKSFQALAEVGEYKVSNIITRMNYRLISHSERNWRNINTVQDLKEIDINNV